MTSTNFKIQFEKLLSDHSITPEAALAAAETNAKNGDQRSAAAYYLLETMDPFKSGSLARVKANLEKAIACSASLSQGDQKNFVNCLIANFQPIPSPTPNNALLEYVYSTIIALEKRLNCSNDQIAPSYLKLAAVYSSQNKRQEAEAIYQTVAKMSYGRYDSKPAALISLAKSYQAGGKLKEADAAYESLLKSIDESNSDRSTHPYLRANALDEYIRFLLSTDQMVKANQYGDIYFAMCTTLGFRYRDNLKLSRLGEQFAKAEQYAEADKFFEAALDSDAAHIANLNGRFMPEPRMTILTSWARTVKTADRVPKVASQLQKAIDQNPTSAVIFTLQRLLGELQTKSGADPKEVARQLQNKMQTIHDQEQARLNEQLKTFKKKEESSSKLLTLLRLAHVDLRNKNLGLAQPHIKDSLELYKRLPQNVEVERAADSFRYIGTEIAKLDQKEARKFWLDLIEFESQKPTSNSNLLDSVLDEYQSNLTSPARAVGRRHDVAGLDITRNQEQDRELENFYKTMLSKSEQKAGPESKASISYKKRLSALYAAQRRYTDSLNQHLALTSTLPSELTLLAIRYLDNDDPKEAWNTYLKALKITKDKPGFTGAQIRFCRDSLTLSKAFAKKEHAKEADEILAESMYFVVTSPLTHVLAQDQVWSEITEKLTSYCNQKKYAEAESLINESIAVIDKVSGHESALSLEAQRYLPYVLLQSGQLKKSETVFNEIINHYLKLTDRKSTIVQSVVRLRVRNLQDKGYLDEAAALKGQWDITD
jgi:tetratricopeptide (TPR) repeat protein